MYILSQSFAQLHPHSSFSTKFVPSCTAQIRSVVLWPLYGLPSPKIFQQILGTIWKITRSKVEIDSNSNFFCQGHENHVTIFQPNLGFVGWLGVGLWCACDEFARAIVWRSNLAIDILRGLSGHHSRRPRGSRQSRRAQSCTLTLKSKNVCKNQTQQTRSTIYQQRI